MSGPKSYELAFARRERERRHNTSLCATCLSAYTRLACEHGDLHLRLAELDLTDVSPSKQPSDLQAEVTELLNRGRDQAAAQVAEHAVSHIRDWNEAARGRLQQRVVELQRRFRQLAYKCSAATSERERLVFCARSAVPSDWPEQHRQTVHRLVERILQSADLPSPVEPELNLDHIRRLEEAESVVATSLRLLQQGREEIASEINKIHAELLTARLVRGLKQPKRLAEVLKERSDPAPASAVEAEVPDKLDRVLASVSVLQGTGGWRTLAAKGEAIRHVGDLDRRRALYEAFLIECGVLLKNLREVERWQAEVDKLTDSVAHLKGTAVDTIVAELLALRRAGRVTDLRGLSARLQSVSAEEEKRLEREEKRRAVLESLAELGYEVEEGAMATALVKGGKLIVRRPAEDEYAVEVVANSEVSVVQTRVIRYAAAESAGEQQRQRDKEREESWCADHARMLESIARRGLQTQFILRIPAGQHPVKVICDEDRIRARRRAAPTGERKVRREKK
jgi:hypothetical protein